MMIRLHTRIIVVKKYGHIKVIWPCNANRNEHAREKNKYLWYTQASTHQQTRFI